MAARCSATAAALETLRLAMAPSVAMRTSRSQLSRVSWRRPLPSAPSTSAERAGQASSSMRSAASSSRPMTMQVELLQLGQRPREVLHQRDRHMLERAGGRLRQRAVERRAVAPGHDEAAGAERRARAQDGADVVRVGHLVEHDEGPPGAALDQLGERGLRQRLGLDQRALMHGVGAQSAVEVPGRDPLVRQLPLGQGFGQAALGVVGEVELADAAVGVGQGRLDRVDAEDRDMIGALGLVPPLGPGRAGALGVGRASAGSRVPRLPCSPDCG